jgi:HEPN domain-containing protein
LPTPEELEVARVYLRKAGSDVAAVRILAADADQQDDVVGFHAQQAVEKSLKAVLAVRGLEIPRTHDVGLLGGLVEGGKGELPDALAEAKALSPWAVAMRYDEMEATLDRESAVRIADAVLGWAQSVVDATQEPGPSAEADATGDGS